jgi:hypothetical protein
LKLILSLAKPYLTPILQVFINHNFTAMTKGLVTKKDLKKKATKSLKEKRKEKKEKKGTK